MGKAILIARVLFGLPLVVFGLNSFLFFMEPDPGAFPEDAQSWLAALEATGYITPLKGAIEVLAGLLVLSGKWVPFALVVFAPILVNIVAFHLVYSPATGAIGYLLLVLELFLAWAYWPHFRGVLQFNARPRTG